MRCRIALLVSRNALLILFFASGTAALIYELVWFHLVTLVVGASSLSIAALLASFMGGMAIGSALAPRMISAKVHPLRVVAILELGIGVCGGLVPCLLPYVQWGYLAAIDHGFSGVLLRAAVCAVALLPPTILMGATLPAISRWTAATPEGASTVGLLYMANIGGGAFGTVLAGFYLLPVHDTIVATGVAVARARGKLAPHNSVAGKSATAVRSASNAKRKSGDERTYGRNDRVGCQAGRKSTMARDP